MEPEVKRKDHYENPEFYVAPDGGLEEVAQITIGDKTAYVICCGQMRMTYNDQMIKFGEQLIVVGIASDEQLNEAFSAEDISVENNPWFEVWVENGDDAPFRSEPEFTVSEAIDTGIEMIKEVTNGA